MPAAERVFSSLCVTMGWWLVGDGGFWPHWQAGTELSAQLETLQAEKEQLRRSVSEKECELLSVHSLVQEKELQLSQEADKASREICELQGRLQEKVQGCVLCLCSVGILSAPAVCPRLLFLSCSSVRSRACSRSCWMSSSASCRRRYGRPRASSVMRWPSWMTHCMSAAPAPQVCPAAPLPPN